jgi:hypothetical protein
MFFAYFLYFFSVIRFLAVIRYYSKLIELLLSRDWVTIDGDWIGSRIYWTLTDRNYK